MIAISKYNKQHPLRVFEAFAGYGSQSLAFKYLKDKHPEFDFKVVGYSEIEPSAIQAYGLLHSTILNRQRDMTFVTIMNKEIIHTAPNGKKYSIQIRKYTPRDCFRLMGVHEADIDKLLSKEKTGQLIISKSKLYALAGNSIVTNCLTAMFEELIFPSGNHYHDKTGQLSLF